MAAQEQGNIALLQQVDQAVAVLDGTIVHIDLALVQQIVVGYRQNAHPRFLRLVQLLLDPFVGLRLNHAAHLIPRLILAGVQHQQAGVLVQIISIAEGVAVAAVGLIVAVLAVNLRKFRRIRVVRRIDVLSLISGGLGIVDIVIARYH